MSTMNLATARNYAEKICEWIRPYCEADPIIAGSIRRERPTCNDVDIVCQPMCYLTKDMFGAVISTENALQSFLENYAASPKSQARINSMGPKSIIIELPKCQLDLWFATINTLATRLMCRTGSMEHNIWLASLAKRNGVKWNPYEGILRGGHWQQVDEKEDYIGGTVERHQSEESIYRALGLPFIDPKNRELPYLKTHFGA